MPKTKSNSFGKLEFTVRRATNRDNMQTSGLANRLAEKLVSLGEEAPPFHYTRIYARMAVQGNGAGCYIRGLVDMNGKPWSVPDPDADIAQHVLAFHAYQDTDPHLTDLIYTELESVDAAPGPEYFWPDWKQSDESRADPNAEPAEPKTSKK